MDDAKYIRHIERQVNATPWYSLWSAAPVPFISFSSENYQIGPFWGLGVVNRTVDLRRVNVRLRRALSCE